MQPGPTVDDPAANAAHELHQLHQSGLLPAAPEVLSHHVWGLLSQTLVGDALIKFNALEQSAGLEAWRITVTRHVSRTRVEIHSLEHAAQNPTRCHRHDDVDAAISRWEEAVRRYHDALPLNSPERFTEQRRLNILLRMLPDELEERAHYEHSNFTTVQTLEDQSDATSAPPTRRPQGRTTGVARSRR